MEPVSLVLIALQAGNVPDLGMEATIPDTIRFLYDDVLDLVQAKLQSVGAGTLLENYMAQPAIYESVLADTLTEAGVNQDAELINAAQSLMKTVDSRTAMHGGFTVDIDDDVEGFV